MASCRATLAFLATSWLAGDVSDIYAKTTAGKVADALGQKLKPDVPPALQESGKKLAQRGRELSDAIGHRDRARVTAITAALRSEP